MRCTGCPNDSWCQIAVLNWRQWCRPVLSLNLLVLYPGHSNLCLVVCQLLFSKLLLINQLLLQLLVWNQGLRRIAHLTQGHCTWIMRVLSSIKFYPELLCQILHMTMLIRYSDLADGIVWLLRILIQGSFGFACFLLHDLGANFMLLELSRW